MIPILPKNGSLKLQWALLLFIQLGIPWTFSCQASSGEKNGGTKTETQILQQRLVELKLREKALLQENALARNPEPYLLVHLSGGSLELKAKGRILRAFKVKRLETNLETIPDTAQVLSEVKPVQKNDRPKIKPGDGEAATVEAVRKNLWGLHRVPQDFKLVFRNGMILGIRALPSERTGVAPVKFLKNLYRKILDRYRHEQSSDQTRSQIIQLWLDENDARLLFWSLPGQFKILIVQG
ncbi:MAG: hypothetical protein JXR49_12945 [Acidobacteria bacterium]|nr:hypothetical protein [Acidobacteriota bacterium]